ncbi:MAG: NAD(P)H-hydrate dehydratase [Parachlamydiaceae bacterium]|nr:NAD(P)H-hydrate dehydratase [Parachlamydiaceae bacterium]
MKIISSKKMSQLESLALRNGFSAADFMEEAGSGVALVVHDYVEKNNLDRIIILLCGKGNNAGDAYVAGIDLMRLDYEVYALTVLPIEDSSPLCKINFERFINEGGRLAGVAFEFPANGVIVDGLFGTGFHGIAEEPYASLIRRANNSQLPIISIDIPSGLNGETGTAEGDVIIASETAFLELPKTGFFLNEGWNHIGKIRYVNFGFPKEYIEDCEPDLIMLSEDILKPLLPRVKRNHHKYERGYVVGLSGSPGMPGASILSSTAVLRGGAGIVKLMHPEGMQAELGTSPYEIIKVPYHYNAPQDIVSLMNQASATYIGPGLGVTQETRQMLRLVLPQLNKPCVIDADALTIISEEEISLPPHTILTPHLGEMMRLLKLSAIPQISMEFLKTCMQYAEKHHVTLILKGGPSFILHPGSPIMVNPTGDPGMATAGSGDVLTGLIAALLSQNLSCKDAASLGVFLHGLAGEHAAEELTSYGMLASDITFHFPEAFRFIMI